MDNPPPPLHAGVGGAAESVQLPSSRRQEVRALHQHRRNVRHRRRRQVCDVIMSYFLIKVQTISDKVQILKY